MIKVFLYSTPLISVKSESHSETICSNNNRNKIKSKLHKLSHSPTPKPNKNHAKLTVTKNGSSIILNQILKMNNGERLKKINYILIK